LIDLRNLRGAWPGMSRRGSADESHGCHHYDARSIHDRTPKQIRATGILPADQALAYLFDDEPSPRSVTERVSRARALPIYPTR
jgi:hypothetical protein